MSTKNQELAKAEELSDADISRIEDVARILQTFDTQTYNEAFSALPDKCKEHPASAPMRIAQALSITQWGKATSLAEHLVSQFPKHPLPHALLAQCLSCLRFIALANRELQISLELSKAAKSPFEDLLLNARQSNFIIPTIGVLGMVHIVEDAFPSSEEQAKQNSRKEVRAFVDEMVDANKEYLADMFAGQRNPSQLSLEYEQLRYKFYFGEFEDALAYAEKLSLTYPKAIPIQIMYSQMLMLKGRPSDALSIIKPLKKKLEGYDDLSIDLEDLLDSATAIEASAGLLLGKEVDCSDIFPSAESQALLEQMRCLMLTGEMQTIVSEVGSFGVEFDEQAPAVASRILHYWAYANFLNDDIENSFEQWKLAVSKDKRNEAAQCCLEAFNNPSLWFYAFPATELCVSKLEKLTREKNAKKLEVLLSDNEDLLSLILQLGDAQSVLIALDLLERGTELYCEEQLSSFVLELRAPIELRQKAASILRSRNPEMDYVFIDDWSSAEAEDCELSISPDSVGPELMGLFKRPCAVMKK